MDKSKAFASIALPLTTISSMLVAAPYNQSGAACDSSPPAPCNTDPCARTYCVGPNNYAVNPPINPRTCDGDWKITVAGLYLSAWSDRLPYAILLGDDDIYAEELLISSPRDFGFKLGVGYNTSCDGWDIGVIWTNFKATGKADDQAPPNFTIDLEHNRWTDLIRSVATAHIAYNTIDIEIGRAFWNSKLLAIRPFIGIRKLNTKEAITVLTYDGDPEKSQLEHTENLSGLGPYLGIDSKWNLGCGFQLYSNFGSNLSVMRYKGKQEVWEIETIAPFEKYVDISQTYSAKPTKLIVDTGLGINWSSVFSERKYALSVSLGWEGHWLDAVIGEWDDFSPKGSLTSIQGWGLTVELDF